ncbi:hypothetical protein GCWU000246_00236 [Jonquetella anthropi E3_33 E1]|nr:hypothetical protein GCWU000246_00236 [Jonquetella anthropi E3_33 E1]
MKNQKQQTGGSPHPPAKDFLRRSNEVIYRLGKTTPKTFSPRAFQGTGSSLNPFALFPKTKITFSARPILILKEAKRLDFY